jgi:OFA family oxalate/formate antiporter-like MFS transporter
MAQMGASRAQPSLYPWGQLAFGIACMVMIANLQYGWTLFVRPMSQAHGWAIADIQIAFSIFVALETWLTPVEGWLADRLGPKLVIAVGGILVAIGWIINSQADSLALLYAGAVVSGIGAGAVYATSVGLAVKWFPDRRGLAVGLTAAGFGACSLGFYAPQGPKRYRAQGRPASHSRPRAIPRRRCSRPRYSGCFTSCSCWCPPAA